MQVNRNREEYAVRKVYLLCIVVAMLALLVLPAAAANTDWQCPRGNSNTLSGPQFEVRGLSTTTAGEDIDYLNAKDRNQDGYVCQAGPWNRSGRTLVIDNHTPITATTCGTFFCG